jgi:hypothetical protein
MKGRTSEILRMTAPENQVTGLLFSHGTTVPADGAAGFETGCLFQKTDGGNGTALFVNEGTAASADFNAIIVA